MCDYLRDYGLRTRVAIPGRRALRQRGQRLTTAILGVLLVAGAGFAAAQKWPQARWWVLASATALAALVVGGGPLWQRWREQGASRAGTVRRSLAATEGPAGDRVPTVGKVDLHTLRVHRAVIDVPYLARPSKEAEVGRHLEAHRPVLLVGSSMVGKTRLAARVVELMYNEHPILIPDTPTSLADLDKADMVPRDHVIWLDDLERFLTGSGLTPGLIKRLAAHNAVVATLRAQEWDRFQPSDRLRPPEWDILSCFEKITLDRERDRPTEDELRLAGHP